MGFGDFVKAAVGAAVPFVGPTVLGGASQIGTSLMNKRMYDKQHQYQTHVEQRNRAQDYDFAQNQIRWLAADAKAAGIHPLAALGASRINPSPTMVGGPSPADMSGLSALGQDIGRAMVAGTTNHQRKIMDLQLKNAEMDTEMKALELTTARRRLGQGGQVGPGIPDVIQNKPAEITSHAKGRRNIEAGSITSTGYARTAGGGLTPVPSKDSKDRIEDQFIPEMVWAAQNYIGPAIGRDDTKPPKSLLPKGAKDWEWSVLESTWYPVKRKGLTPFGRLKKRYKAGGQSLKWWLTKKRDKASDWGYRSR